MTLKKEYIVLFIIIAVLSAYLVFQKKGRIHYELPQVENIDKNDITKLLITKEGSEIILLKENDKWFISPENFSADNARLEKMLDDISTLTLTALASESKNYSIYELSGDRRIVVEAFKDDNALRMIGIGKTTSSNRQTFITLNDDHRVFHVKNNLRQTFDTTVSELRDKTVMNIKEEIGEITLTKGKDSIKILMSSAPVSIDPQLAGHGEEQVPVMPKWVTSDGISVNEYEIDGLINTLTNLLCNEFITGKTKADFKSPVYTVDLKGMNTFTISLFEKEENGYPAISSGSDYPFFLSEWKAEKIMKDLNTLKGSVE